MCRGCGAGVCRAGGGAGDDAGRSRRDVRRAEDGVHGRVAADDRRGRSQGEGDEARGPRGGARIRERHEVDRAPRREGRCRDGPERSARRGGQGRLAHLQLHDRPRGRREQLVPQRRGGEAAAEGEAVRSVPLQERLQVPRDHRRVRKRRALPPPVGLGAAPGQPPLEQQQELLVPVLRGPSARRELHVLDRGR